MLRRFAIVLIVVQSVLFLAHFLLFLTILAAWGPAKPSSTRALGVALAILSVFFLGSSLLAFRNANFGPHCLSHRLGVARDIQLSDHRCGPVVDDLRNSGCDKPSFARFSTGIRSLWRSAGHQFVRRDQCGLATPKAHRGATCQSASIVARPHNSIRQRFAFRARAPREILAANCRAHKSREAGLGDYCRRFV